MKFKDKLGQGIIVCAVFLIVAHIWKSDLVAFMVSAGFGVLKGLSDEHFDWRDIFVASMVGMAFGWIIWKI